MRARLSLRMLPLVFLAVSARADGRAPGRTGGLYEILPALETRNPGHPPPPQPPSGRPPGTPPDGGANAWNSGTGGDGDVYGDVSVRAHARTSILRPGRESSALPLFWLILLAVLSFSVLWMGLSLVRQARNEQGDHR